MASPRNGKLRKHMCVDTMADALWQWLRLKVLFKLIDIYVIPRAKLSVLFARLVGRKHPNAQHALSNATVRWLSRHLSISQFNAATTSTTDPVLALDSYPTLKQLGAGIEHVETSAFRAIYMPKYSCAPYVVLHVHGGGFVSGSPESSAAYLLQLSLELKVLGVTADILSVKYTLAPEAKYPVALGQVVSAYLEIMSQNKPIIILGDSAGATLCLGLLRHLSFPREDLPTPPNGAKERIVAACLVSPWVNLKNDHQSPQLVEGIDCLDIHALHSWRDAYLNGKDLDDYNHPARTRTGWRECLPRSVLLMTGDLDMFGADILELSKAMEKDGAEGVETYVAPLRGHSWNLVDFGLAEAGTRASMASEKVKHAYDGVLFQSRWIFEQLKEAVGGTDNLPAKAS